MKIQLELTKRELDLLTRGMSALLSDEHDRSKRGGGRGWVPTQNYLAAEALEAKLIAADAASRKAVQS
jgi:hypothetical protein